MMHKQFVVLKRNDDTGIGSTNSRLYDLLYLFGLQDRTISDEEEAVGKLSAAIDYGRVEKELKKQRDDSVTWLLKGLAG